ncbi:MAG: hypothetical protein HYV95_01025 [Opitutae bacterium]|nr:hypothetical protein [Opitutae bacterium]
MFIGHIAVALAAKRAAPTVSLGVLFAAAQLPDLVWPVLLLTGAEQVEIRPGITAFTPLDFVSYPWSHSLLMVVLTGSVAGAFYAWRAKNFPGGALLVLLAVSHWVLDWISHRPDMPLVPGGTRHGLGLWNSIPSTLLVEGGMFLAGTMLYATGSTAQDRTGRYAFWSLIGFLGCVYAADRFSSPPPGAAAIAWVNIAAGVGLYFWAAWADCHRVARQ